MGSYPHEPGARHGSPQESHDAAKVAARTAQKTIERIENELRVRGAMSPEELTASLALPGERLLLTSIRARCTQLKALGRVTDSGLRGVGESLHTRVIKWRLTTPEERSRFAALKALEDRDDD